ncbi:uncharacterized protein METZ01_LOCUS233283, partial [marine metagenome]
VVAPGRASIVAYVRVLMRNRQSRSSAWPSAWPPGQRLAICSGHMFDP